MKNSKLCIAAIGLIAITSTVHAAPRAHHAVAASPGGANLWHGVRVGMTADQVGRILPGLAKNDRNNDFHAPATQVAGASFDVGVEMIDGHVARVSLTSAHALPTEVKSALDAKFGAESKPYDCQMGIYYRCSGEWRAPGNVTVSLIQITMTGASSTEIRYEAPDTAGL